MTGDPTRRPGYHRYGAPVGGAALNGWVRATGVIVVLVVSARKGTSTLGAAAVGMVVGGAAGNIADRLFRSDEGFLQGKVIDFIDFQWWPVFNVADIGVVVGGVLLVISAWRASREPVG